MEATGNRRVDAWNAAQRCLDAIAETQDVETRRSLWNAALRFAHDARECVAGIDRLELVNPRPRARRRGGSGGVGGAQTNNE